MDDQPKSFSRAEILERYWGEFFEIQLREYEKRKNSGWGVAKGLFAESEFWEWLISAKPEAIKGIIAQEEA